MTAHPAPDAAHIRALPKVELHVHVEGAAPATTVAELARANGVDLGVDDPADLYRYRDLADFLRVFDLVCATLVRSDDIARVTYESLVMAADAGVRRREMFFSPTFLLRKGVAFATIWEGIAAGIADARTDTGIDCVMICDIDKPSGPGPARELIELAAGCDRDLLIGLGGDAGEMDVDLAALAEPFAHARSRGLRTTMHLGEEGPATDIALGLDVVGVERIDHGFSLLDDAGLTARVADAGIACTVCPTSNRSIGLVDAITDHPVIAMRDAGVVVTLNSDNAAMFGIDLADEYTVVADAFGCSLDELEDFSLAAVDAAWIDDTTRRAMRSDFVTEMQRLRRDAGLPARSF
jgi:adenosine deaminase